MKVLRHFAVGVGALFFWTFVGVVLSKTVGAILAIACFTYALVAKLVPKQVVGGTQLCPPFLMTVSVAGLLLVPHVAQTTQPQQPDSPAIAATESTEPSIDDIRARARSRISRYRDQQGWLSGGYSSGTLMPSGHLCGSLRGTTEYHEFKVSYVYNFHTDDIDVGSWALGIAPYRGTYTAANSIGWRM